MTIISSGLGNRVVGGVTDAWSTIRILPKKDGWLVADRCQWIIDNPDSKMNLGQAGYAHGFRGVFAEYFAADNNGAPGTVVGLNGRRSVFQADLHEYNHGIFPLVVFSPVEVRKDVPVWRVWKNVCADPVNDFASLDFLIGGPAQCPDMQVWRSVNGALQADSLYLPSPYTVFYADGDKQGYPYYEIVNGVAVDGTANFGF